LIVDTSTEKIAESTMQKGAYPCLSAEPINAIRQALNQFFSNFLLMAQVTSGKNCIAHYYVWRTASCMHCSENLAKTY